MWLLRVILWLECNSNMLVIQITALCIYSSARCGTSLPAEDCVEAGAKTRSRTWRTERCCRCSEVNVKCCFAKQTCGDWHSSVGMLCTLSKIVFRGNIHEYIIVFEDVTIILHVFKASSLGHSPFWTKVVSSECILWEAQISVFIMFSLKGGYVQSVLLMVVT